MADGEGIGDRREQMDDEEQLNVVQCPRLLGSSLPPFPKERSLPLTALRPKSFVST